MSDLALSQPSELELKPSFHAIATSALEMQKAKAGIRTWLDEKVKSIEAELIELQEAHDAAVRHKWKSSTFKTQLQRKKQEHLYYGKLVTACDAGYTIVPNMDVSVFAIRVNKDKPYWSDYGESYNSFHAASPLIPAQSEQRLPVGEGHYVSPEMEVKTQNTKRKNLEGKEVYVVSHGAIGFEEIAFPLAIAHPIVMDATAQAMSLKIFDRIGIVPAGMRKRRGDPMVLGQITRKVGYETKIASFLIAWYVDARTL